MNSKARQRYRIMWYCCCGHFVALNDVVVIDGVVAIVFVIGGNVVQWLPC